MIKSGYMFDLAQKDSKWKEKLFILNCQNFDVTVRPLNINKFLQNLIKRVFVQSLQLELR